MLKQRKFVAQPQEIEKERQRKKEIVAKVKRILVKCDKGNGGVR